MAHFARPRQWEIETKIFFGGRIYRRLAEKFCGFWDGACYFALLLGETWALILESESTRCTSFTYW